MNKKNVSVLILLLFLIIPSFNLYAIGEDIPDNSTQMGNTGETVTESTGNVQPNSNGSVTGVKGDTLKLADDMESSGSSFLNSLDGVFRDMEKADDGAVFDNVSKAMSKPVAAVSQVLRAAFIGIIMLLTVPDFLALLVPALEGPLSGKGRGGSGQMGTASGGRAGLLSADYYAVSGGSGMSGGGEGGMSGSKRKNRIIEYTKMRLVTTISAVVAMLLLMTPFGFAGVMYIVKVCLAAITYLFRMGAGGI